MGVVSLSDFIAKPSGGYNIQSAEGTNNILRTYDYLAPLGYDKQCVIGILGNVAAESGLNPWRWQGDTVTYSDGYGLVQFTPASGYINLTGIPDHAPNLSVSQTTTGADPDDAKGQLYVFANDILGKWNNTCWRSYWNSATYPDLWALHTSILNTYGNGSSLTMAQFAAIDNYSDACFAFLACYEGPTIPNYSTRLANAALVADILNPYGPTTGLDILVLKKVIDRNFKRVL